MGLLVRVTHGNVPLVAQRETYSAVLLELRWAKLGLGSILGSRYSGRSIVVMALRSVRNWA